MFVRMMFRLATLFAFVVQAAVAAPTTTLPIKHLYVLGDSLSDQGNLFFATSVLGAPLHLPALPDAEHYYLGRFSNGENYAGLLASKLGITLQPSQLGGTNFAFGGARTDYNIVEFRPGLPPVFEQGFYPIGAYPWSLDSERAAFVARARHGSTDPTGLYIVFSGSNDLSDALIGALSPLHLNPAPGVIKAVAGVRNVVLAFKAAGARTILVPLVPNLGLVPAVTRFGPAASMFAQALTQQFNDLLIAALSTIDGPNIIVFDTFSFLTDLVSRPGDFGLTNVTSPCYSGFVEPDPTATECSNPDQYVFWDIEHPTTRVHAILADELFATVFQCQGKGNGRFTAHCAVNGH